MAVRLLVCLRLVNLRAANSRIILLSFEAWGLAGLFGVARQARDEK
jgi:hypothetical protein